MDDMVNGAGHTQSYNSMKRIAIIGGGISGLAAALRLREVDPAVQFTLYDASHRLGGAIETVQQDGFLIERGADMFTTRVPWAADLCRRIGLADQLIETNEGFRSAFVVHGARLCRVPDGFTLMRPTRLWPFLATPLLSWRGKIRVGWEYFVRPRAGSDDESLANFARRRFGDEAYQRLIQPLIGGIYTADPEQLSMRAALPEFFEMEQQHGGLIRAAVRSPRRAGRESGARYGSFRAPREGMGALIAAIASRLPNEAVYVGRRVTSVNRREGGRWKLDVENHSDDADYDGLVIAVPAHAAARLLARTSSRLADALDQIQYASAAVVALGYRRNQIGHSLDGFGCVAPLCEKRKILSISFSSVKFAGRAPPGKVLMRVFIGGACQPNLLELDDGELQQIAEQEVAELLDAQGRPELCDITRWRRAMPQYQLAHLQRVELIERLASELPGVRLAGNAFDGVGVPFCVRRGEQAMDSLLAGM
jgi:oxygen-dependent protoporphyrinogen oxidase